MIVIFRRASLVLSALYCACHTAQAAFIHDGSGSLELRNFYFDRDFHGDSATQSRRGEWAQGFMLRLQSGYTDGVVGFGLDAAGMLGLKLDSSPDRSGSGLLPRGSDKRAADDYAKAVATFKARLAQSELKAGGLSPQLPLLASNSSRLFPQWFSGVQLVSKDLDRFTLTLLQVDATKLRDSTDYEDLTAMAQQGAYSATVTSDRLRYAGVDYQPLNNLTLSLHTSVLEDLFRRDFAGFKFKTRLGPGDVFTEWRWFNAREQGRALLGGVDNQTLSTNFGYSVQGHTLSGGYQKVRGDTAYAYVGGTDTYLFSEQQVSTFALANDGALRLQLCCGGHPRADVQRALCKGRSGGPATHCQRQGQDIGRWRRRGAGMGADYGYHLCGAVGGAQECVAALAQCEHALEFCRCSG